jgi:hypothetical protein
MSKYNTKDMMLLEEAYNLTLLKENMQYMTLGQINNKIHLMSESEVKYVCDVSERILEGFWGGVKNVAGGVAQGVGNVAKGVGTAVANKAGQAVQGVKQVGSGLKAAGQQVAGNVKNMYQTGSVNADTQKSVAQAQELTTQLQQLIQQAIDNGLLSIEGGTADNIPLGELVATLQGAQDAAGNMQQQARNTGITGGVGGAFKQGFQS